VECGGKRLRELAEWHFGEGPDYCRGCVETEAPCARAEPWACRYRELQPQSEEGAAAWGLITACGTALRVGPAGPIGFDWPSILAAADAWDVERAALVRFLPEIERGMVAARLARAERES
jgi:hypothetical protein